MYCMQEKLEKNKRKIESDVSHLFSTTSRRNVTYTQENGFSNMPLCKYSGFSQGLGDKEYANCHEVVFSISTKLPYMEKIPPYTTWIFLDKYDP